MSPCKRRGKSRAVVAEPPEKPIHKRFFLGVSAPARKILQPWEKRLVIFSRMRKPVGGLDDAGITNIGLGVTRLGQTLILSLVIFSGAFFSSLPI
jgi:hypothetical protein